MKNKHRKQERNERRAMSLRMGIRVRWKRPKGVLVFKGKIPEEQLEAFRRQWYAMISGPGAERQIVVAGAGTQNRVA